jgi:hypothetical protein
MADFTGHVVKRKCYARDFHLAYCTTITNAMGQISFCDERFQVSSLKGCGKDGHQFNNDYNRFYKETMNRGSAKGLPQPILPSEEEHQFMLAESPSDTEEVTDEYHNKEPRQKTKDKQGKKQQLPQTVRDYTRQKKTRELDHLRWA